MSRALRLYWLAIVAMAVVVLCLLVRKGQATDYLTVDDTHKSFLAALSHCATAITYDTTTHTFGCNPGGGGGGESNTASNLGGGLANWDSKVGVDLRFNTFAAADFDLAANLITIDDTKWATDAQVASAIAAAVAGYQPLDADLTDLSDGAISYAKLDSVPTSRILGRVTAGTGAAEALTGTQATTLLDTFGAAKGLVPLSAGGTTNYLRADGSWNAPPGTPPANYVANVADGTGIDGTASGAGSTYTPSLDLTEITCTGPISCPAATTISTNMNTARLLGRTTAAAGVAEELTATAPLSLAAGTLTTSVATTTLAGRTTAGTGVLEALSVTSPLSLATAGTLTTSIATQRLMGRTTAGSGAEEQLTVTSPLTLTPASGTLSLGDVALGGGTSGNFVASVATAGLLSGGQAGSEGTAISLTTSLSGPSVVGRTTAGAGTMEQLTVDAPLSVGTAGHLGTSVATGIVMGRTTAGTGAEEQLTVDAPLSTGTPGHLTTSIATQNLAGRTTAGTGAIEALTVTSPLSLATAGTLTTSMTTARILGRTTAGTGAVEQLTQVPETLGGTNQTTYTQGDIIYSNGANTLAKLGAGTNGQLLKTAGAAANPAWSGTWRTVTLGPFYINALPASATTQAQQMYWAGSTNKVVVSTNDVKINQAAHVIGAYISSDSARSGGTATVQPRINGSATAFNSGSVVLNATNTTSMSDMVYPSAGLAVTANQTVGCAVVTSSWAPTTANIQCKIVISYD